VYRLTDVPDGYRTEVLRTGEERICITAAPLIGKAELKDHVLQCELRYDSGHTAHSVIMPIAEPAQVEVDGAELAKHADLGAIAEGWAYDENLGCVTVKLSFGADARRLRVIQAKPKVSRLPLPQWEFNRPNDTEGWGTTHDVKPLRVEGGRLIIEADGGDPYLSSPGIMAEAETMRGLQFRARATAPGGQVFWANEDGGFAPGRSASFDLPADGQYHVVEIDLSGHAQWKGLISRIRLDTAGAPCIFEVDWIRPLKGPQR